MSIVPLLGLPQGFEWIIIAVVALVLFGGAKLTSFGKNAGKAIREFKEETASLNKGESAPTVEDPATDPKVVKPTDQS
ncbi:MAG: twin-arginine translocase TatA/TatE family subunit [Propionibacteriaceae bacterium]|jgi:sec-independent protein translocase protein TatA|nr:twin-arginine translocase TatA/TatE family subunit [Micropruina sp.]HBX82020.1 Sec-independent protein translocase TatA [Propionibacteriaceae bacterium]HBY24191.1 Sec-independent protein translocase TatA [Propionibacteriaceae bacterium]